MGSMGTLGTAVGGPVQPQPAGPCPVLLAWIPVAEIRSAPSLTITVFSGNSESSGLETVMDIFLNL